MTDNIPPITYGVWLPGRGWLKGANHQAFGDTHKEVAEELAFRIGTGAKVYYIDKALVDLEAQLLEAESLRIPLFKRIHRMLKTGGRNAIP